MHLTKPEKFKTLYVDPGESTGWCLANGPKLLARGTTPMWTFADDVWYSLTSSGTEGPLGCGSEALPYAVYGVGEKGLDLPISRIVCEDFVLYPDKAKALAWDELRTVRLIGALTFMARVWDIPFALQAAAIKDDALALGAAELFDRPLVENRHQNDAIQHFVYYRNFGDKPGPATKRIVADSQGRTYQAQSDKYCLKVLGQKKGDKQVCLMYRDHEGEHTFTTPTFELECDERA